MRPAPEVTPPSPETDIVVPSWVRAAWGAVGKEGVTCDLISDPCPGVSGLEVLDPGLHGTALGRGQVLKGSEQTLQGGQSRLPPQERGTAFWTQATEERVCRGPGLEAPGQFPL